MEEHKNPDLAAAALGEESNGTADELTAGNSEQRKPVYDSREYDDGGRVIRGSVYYELEPLVKGKKEAEDALYRAESFAKRADAQRLAAEQRYTEVMQRLQSAEQMVSSAGQPRPDSDQARSPNVRLPESVRSVLPDEAADELERWGASLLTSVNPERIVSERITAFQRQQEEAVMLNDLNSLVDKNQEFYGTPSAFTTPDSIKYAASDPQHPDHKFAVRLIDLYDLTQKLGSLQSAHDFLQVREQRTDIKQQIEAARRDEREKLLREFKEKGARFVPTGGLDGSRGVPTREERLKLSPEERNTLRVREAEKFDWTGLS